MYKIEKHPILDIAKGDEVTFLFEGHEIKSQKGFTIASALHQAGFPVHSHSLKNRARSLECGIGKCGACEMLVDGELRRICITKVDDVKEVAQIPHDFYPKYVEGDKNTPYKVYRTKVAIIGAGPAGLAVREALNEHSIANIVIDNNDSIGGQFLMQTHQFFFFEKEKRFGGMRGFDIIKTLAGDTHSGILLNSTVWDLFENQRIAVKNVLTQEIYFVDAEYFVVATGAVPFIPPFKNDDVPGVYTAAVIQKMMNTEYTLLGKKMLTVGAGNIGYLTSYQAMQAGVEVKAIIEQESHEGGFPVQANRIKRMGIPILTNYMLMEAIPNKDKTAVVGAIIAKCKNGKFIHGTEQIIEDIDVINICTGLMSDGQLLIKGNELFGKKCYGVGDAVRIGEGTTAVLRGKQCAYEIMQDMKIPLCYNEYLSISREYIESQQQPVKILQEPMLPSKERMLAEPFVLIDCLYGFACNPCTFVCKSGAITKTSTNVVPQIDFDKCTGCMDCIHQCPGMAIIGYNLSKSQCFIPFEYEAKEGQTIFLVDNNGNKLGEGRIEKISVNMNKTNVAKIKVLNLKGEDILQVRGFILKDKMPKPLKLKKVTQLTEAETYICHCDDVQLETLLEVIGERKFISVEELKHTTRLGMGTCRGKRCLPRAKQILRSYGISVIGDITPRASLSNPLFLGELYPKNKHERIITHINTIRKVEKVDALIVGGGIAGSSLLRYMSEAGYKPVMVNDGHGSSWRNIAGGRPAFSHPALADIAMNNRDIFKSLQKVHDINFRDTRYVTFAHDEATYKALEESKAWSKAYMVAAKDFQKEISPHFNAKLKTYKAALITEDCWQATPGKTVDLVRNIAIGKGGVVLENSCLIDVEKQGKIYKAIVYTHDKQYVEYHTEIFINAAGAGAGAIAKKLGMELGLYPIKHQAFITRRMPMMGKDGAALDMLIDRRKYKGFSAVYGQQLYETGQLIACASPAVDPLEADKNLKTNSQDFMEIISEIFVDWIPELATVGMQATWSGYYTEPRYIIDPELGLFVGMRGHGFMLSQYIAKLYVDALQGKSVPDYFKDLKLNGKGISENAFK